MASFKKRAIRETDLFRSGKASFQRLYSRMDDVLYGITDKIASEPKRFPRVAGWEVRRARTDSFPPDIPSFAIWYTFDEDTVLLELIELWTWDVEINPDDESTLGEDD